MKKNLKTKPRKPASRVIGTQAFAAITAVEGLHLSVEGKKRLAVLRASDLSPAQRRAEVVRAYAKLAGKSLQAK